MIKLENKNLRPRDPDNLPGGCWYVNKFDDYLWTWEAGMKEAEEQGKRLPTYAELEYIFKDETVEHDEIKRSIKCAGYEFPLVGYYLTEPFTLIDYGNGAGLWSSTVGGIGAYGRLLYYDDSTVDRGSRHTPNRFSVRCVDNNFISKNITNKTMLTKKQFELIEPMIYDWIKINQDKFDSAKDFWSNFSAYIK
jgi:hypothetical protein